MDLDNLEQYRIGKNYKASNIVFPIEYEGEKCIVKKPRKLSTIINAYYAFQGRFFYKDRKFSTGKKAIQQEIKKLSQLQGFHAPKLKAYTDRLLIKEFIEGATLKDFTSTYGKVFFLKGALVAMEGIHNQDLIIGDAHIKNLIKGNKGYSWIDFDGVYNEADLIRAKALDVLKMVYSTYGFTKDEKVVGHAAVIVENYGTQQVRRKLLDIISSEDLSNFSAWFSTRVNARLNREIKNLLKIVC